uniref:Fibrinogen C-terminal domain-containing protein n=1 Tax=Magallana gigas TaxID=29159 RepID=A0A8W8LQ20_MAGGI
MRMDMRDFKNQTRYVKYSGFNVGHETSKYNVNLYGYSGIVDDCFGASINNMMFTTKDQDNDKWLLGNCAEEYQSGWWHNRCHCANPNGVYLAGNTSIFAVGIVYQPWRGYYYSLKSTQLMTDYKKGFGDLRSEFWLGNDILHYLLSQGRYMMRMDMADFDNQTRYVKYSYFNVGDETSKYNVTVFGHSGDVGDCFTTDRGINHMMFSTKYQDNDILDKRTCAVIYQSGWWYRKCQCANPNGKYLAGHNDKFGVGITYEAWRGQYYSLKFTQFMVKKSIAQFHTKSRK